MKKNKILIGVPTYNEVQNIEHLIIRILSLQNAQVDVLIVDDCSPDGTGIIANKLADENKCVRVMHRKEKSGIGSAHLEIIHYAYKHRYEILITMDADFSHAPEDIEVFITSAKDNDIVIGSRFNKKEGLQNWDVFRKFVTRFGHFLTKTLLRMPFDATGGLRLYKLKNIPQSYFSFIKNTDYEFFFISLTVLNQLGCKIIEVPIILHKRANGASKMQLFHAFKGTFHLLKLSITLNKVIKQITEGGDIVPKNPKNEWDQYWENKKGKVLYDVIASFYRHILIKPNLNRFIKRNFPKGAYLLHAGCGGGETDIDITKYADVTAMDLSSNAIYKYKKMHGDKCKTILGSIFNIPVSPSTFDGIYNLGVMEHFLENEIVEILREFNRVLTPAGKIVLFWPPSYGLSVFALRIIHLVMNAILHKGIRLHPDEPTHIKSKGQIKELLSQAGFSLEEFSFGARDAFTYVIVVASKDKTSKLASVRGVEIDEK